jgi:hypothetical protein
MQNQNEQQQQIQAEEPVSYGYLNGSYTMGVDDPQTLQDKADAEAASTSSSVSSEELASIASKLGVDVNALAGLLGVGQQQEEQPSSVEEAAEDTTEPETSEEEPEDDKKLRERLLTVDKEVKELLGVGLHDVYGLLQDLQQFKAQYVVEQQTNILKQEWGDNYQDTLLEVKGYWEKLPAAQKQALDNVEGARLIHALLTKDKATASSTSVRQQNPQFIRQGSVRPRSGAAAKFRMSEVVKLSESEYMRIQPELEAAFRNGQVVNDIR